MLTTIGQVLVNDALPPRFRDYSRVMDSKGIEEVLQAVAREAPETYAAVTKRLMDIGNAAAYDTGTTIRLSDLRPSYDKRPILQALDIAERQIRADKSLTDAQKAEMDAISTATMALRDPHGDILTAIEQADAAAKAVDITVE